MKILQINSVCGIGSTGRMATDIHKSLIEQGHDSYIAYGRNLSKNCNNAIRIGKSIHTYAHVAKTRLFDMHGLGSQKATVDFIDKVKILDPDIIHLHNIHGYYINIEILFEYLKDAKKPVIWTLHDCWSFTGHCANFDYIGCNKWQTECFSCPQKNEYPQSLFLDNSKWNYNKKKEIFTGISNLTIITPSEWLSDLVKKSFLNNYKIKTIHNGIDLSVFRSTKSNFREKYQIVNKYVILGVSNVWNKRKGWNHFLDLAKIISDDEVIVLVGVSEKQKSLLPKNIIGISKTDSTSELSEIYSSSDVFLNLTLEDNYPTVNLEALACGTYVVTYDTGGCKETVLNQNASVVQERTSVAAYASIKKIKNQKNTNIKNNLNIIDFNRIVISYNELYKMILNE